ncbi:MAG: polymerase subunit gamma and tau, partial [Nitrospirae bacterium]|nr:polymerase subunit gamma and tau [Nitrospirota bacterium]
MSYLVLARKWRPQGFDDLIGQEPIMHILKNALVQSKISHAYIFSGPRGVGKTSTARIL